jgi:hypothetical protein
MYTGPLFTAARAWAERNTDALFIASAKHRVLDPETGIEPYDLALSDLDAESRRSRVRQIQYQFHRRWVQFCQFGMGPAGYIVAVEKPRVVLLASREYLGGFYELLRQRRDCYEFEDPLAGLSIGQRIAWLRNHTIVTRHRARQLMLFAES